MKDGDDIAMTAFALLVILGVVAADLFFHWMGWN
jgi:hypothetical protein